jgi:membrane protease subunit HflK
LLASSTVDDPIEMISIRILMETLMAWNEPGNNGKDRDPWGNNGRIETPDLDEMLRKVSRRFGGLLGGGKSGGGDVGKFGLSIALVVR